LVEDTAACDVSLMRNIDLILEIVPLQPGPRPATLSGARSMCRRVARGLPRPRRLGPSPSIFECQNLKRETWDPANHRGSTKIFQGTPNSLSRARAAMPPSHAETLQLARRCWLVVGMGGVCVACCYHYHCLADSPPLQLLDLLVDGRHDHLFVFPHNCLSILERFLDTLLTLPDSQSHEVASPDHSP